MYIYIIYILFYMDNDIEKIYKQFNYPSSVQKLLKLVKAAGIQATGKDIKSFLDKRIAVQQTKIIGHTKSKEGHIISFKTFDLLQVDIYVLLKYSKQNKGYGYILAVVDVFSRKAFCYPMKNKTLEDTTQALKNFFQEPDVKKYKSGISVFMSDSDSSFLGGSNQGDERDFNKIMDDNDSILDPVKNQDHHSLGIIDRFARTLKTILTKHFLEEGSTNWINELDTIVKNYNDTPTEALENHTPNQAIHDQETQFEILHLNMDKNKKNIQIHKKGADLVSGDHVRVREANIFKKGTEPRWSDEVYTVEGVKGLSVTLTNDKVYKRDSLLKIPKDTIKITHSTVKPNVIKVATKQRKQDIILKSEDIKEENIRTSKRQPVANKQFNDYIVSNKK